MKPKLSNFFTEEENEKLLNIINNVYKSSLLSKSEFISAYNNFNNIIEGYSFYNEVLKLKICDILFQKMYYSDNKACLESFEYFINENIDFSKYFVRNLVSIMLKDKEMDRIQYQAIIIKIIKKHKDKRKLYEYISKVSNMKYFFKRAKQIEMIIF